MAVVKPKSKHRFIVIFKNYQLSKVQSDTLSINVNKVQIEIGENNQLIIHLRDTIDSVVQEVVYKMQEREDNFNIQIQDLDGTNNTTGYHSSTEYYNCKIERVKTEYDYTSPDPKVIELYISFLSNNLVVL